LLELQAAQSAPRFGTCDELDINAYYAVIHDARDVCTVVHVYDDVRCGCLGVGFNAHGLQRLVSCRRLTSKLHEIASRHTALRVRTLQASLLSDQAFEVEALPLLLIYRYV
jgi:hypothetical protein